MHGTISDQDGRWLLLFERELSEPPNAVWRALTEDQSLGKWYPTTIEGERKVGAPLRFVFAGDDGPPLSGEVVAFDPPRAFAFNEGTNELRFELSDNGAGSALRFTHSFDKGASIARTATGWHICLDLLEAHLKGAVPGFNRESRWAELHRDYVARFLERDPRAC